MASPLLRESVVIPKEQIEQVHKETGLVTWLLGMEDKRLYQICGHDLGNGVCSAKAGSGTSHEGIGPCLEHEVPFIPHVLDIITKANIPQPIVEIIERQQTVDRRLLQTIDPEIQMMYMTLELQMRNLPENGDGIPPAMLGSIQKTLGQLTSMKKDRRVMEDKMTLDMGVVQDLVTKIIQVVTLNTNEVQGRRILHEILNEVVKPMRAEGKIVGMIGS